MPITLTIHKYMPATNHDVLFADMAFTGNYTTGGDVLNLTPSSMKDPGARGAYGPNQLPAIPPGVFTKNVQGYNFEVVPGTTLQNYALKVFTPAGVELAAGAYPVAITGGTAVLMIPFENK